MKGMHHCLRELHFIPAPTVSLVEYHFGSELDPVRDMLTWKSRWSDIFFAEECTFSGSLELFSEIFSKGHAIECSRFGMNLVKASQLCLED